MDRLQTDNTFPVEHLLPIRAAEITLRFLAPARVHPFHQPALTGFLRTLLGSPKDYDLFLTVDAPESGHINYRLGDRYRFTLIALPGGDDLLRTALGRLRELPDTSDDPDPAVPFRDNLAFCGAHDLFRGQPIRYMEDLTEYSQDTLDFEVERWRDDADLRIRWLSPVRLLLDKPQRFGLKGEARFCRRRGDLYFELLANRLHDTFADLLRRRGLAAPPRHGAAAVELTAADLFWVDSRYRDGKGHEQVMGGLMGSLDLRPLQALPFDTVGLLVLGQYLGIGQRRAFGWGRYRLERTDGDTTYRRAEPATSLLERAADRDNLAAAYAAIRANQPRASREPPPESSEEQAWVELDGLSSQEDLDEDDFLADRLKRLAERLASGRYRPPSLTGVIRRESDGDLRALAIPPFMDRVAQRAVAQVLTPGLELLMYHGSFGYRPRRSRQSARQMIQQAFRDGYRWVYESDIEDFFDSVDWSHLATRLAALYGTDPLVELILNWMAAPVEYEDQIIERSAGLPQGSPLSPLLANLMLDDFDSDLETAGFRLARFADDFVILCKDREEAEAASRAATAALAEIGLRLNQSKTAIRSFNQGFRYLGYLFVNELALDTSRNKQAQEANAPSAKPPVPPRGWLAKLAERTPKPLAADGKPKLPRPPPATSKPTTLRLGEDSNTGAMLFVTGAPTLLVTRQGRLLLERDGEPVADMPWTGLQGIVLIGPHSLTTPALRYALKREIPIHFAGWDGFYQGTAWTGRPGAEGCALWLEQQRCFADVDKALSAAVSVVEARLRHMREVLRQRGVDGRCDSGMQAIDRTLGRLGQATSLSGLHGLEGQATRSYYDALKPLIPDQFGFDGRNRRPPRDPFNALPSLGYTILYAHADTILRASGLLPWVGFYHQPHGRHAVLASDLMEPFRHLVERTALAAVTRRRLKPEHFDLDPESGCRLKPEARKNYLAILSERFDMPVTALHGNKAGKLHEHLHNQNLALIDWIRGRSAAFQAWRMR